ncbi:hypothetical protein Ciccas_002529 [Cichlidogyrus casuarinus]|uniref:Uncharacterized protein n=1 Tax=Cichlidogyrus casuarinus TaxID=1844966 RepID=A0ABD2QH05_9PLAT
MNRYGIILGDLLSILYIYPTALDENLKKDLNDMIMNVPIEFVELLSSDYERALKPVFDDTSIAAIVSKQGLLVYNAGAQIPIKEPLLSGFKALISSLPVPESELERMLFDLIPIPENLYNSSIQEICSFIPACLVKRFGNIVGIGVICQLFLIIFIHVFIDTKSPFGSFSDIHRALVESPLNMKAERETIQSRLHKCHADLTVLFSQLKNAKADIFSAGAALQARYRLEIDRRSFCDRSEKDIQLDRQRGNLFSSYHEAKTRIYNFLVSLQPLLENFSKSVAIMEAYIDFLIEDWSFLGAFSSQSDYRSYLSKISDPNSPTINKKIYHDCEVAKAYFNNEGQDDSEGKIAFKTCTMLAAFFFPTNFKKCLLVMQSQIRLIREDLFDARRVIFTQWVKHFQSVSEERCFTSAKTLPDLLTKLQFMLDKMELWFRCINKNALVYYSHQMMQGINLYISNIQINTFQEIEELKVPKGCKNDETVPSSVSYQRFILPSPTPELQMSINLEECS